VSIYGHFYPNGANPISTQKVTGGTFARTGVGVITFTFSEPVLSSGYWYPSAKLNMGTPDGSYAMITTVSQAASGIVTATIGTFDAAHNPADIAADATNVVTFKMKVKVKGP
jgi:hypothetical protein